MDISSGDRRLSNGNGKINIVLDGTLLDTFMNCQRKFYYRFELRRETPTKPKALDKGGIVHVGYETYYKLLKEGKDFVYSLDGALMSARLSLTKDSDLSTEDGRLCLNTIEESLNYWRQADTNLQILGVEESFAYILYEDDKFRIMMIGKIDLRFSDRQYENCPLDHKTYSRDFPVLRKTNQFCNYATSLNSDYLFVNRVGFQTTLKPPEKYKRVPLSYDEQFRKQWRDNTIKWAMRYYDCIVDNDWPMNDTSCTKYNRVCEYYDVCDSSGEDTKEFKLNFAFKVGEAWDVSKILTLREED